MCCRYRELRSTVRKFIKKQLHLSPKAYVTFEGLSEILQRRRSENKARFPVELRNFFDRRSSVEMSRRDACRISRRHATLILIYVVVCCCTFVFTVAARY